MTTYYDAIIVGGGHHGLTAAAYLARAGKQVVVLEDRPWFGGMTYSRETVAEAPGYVMNPCAVDLLFTNFEPSIVAELDLARHGLRQVAPDPWGSYLGLDGEAIGMWRSLDRTCDEISRYSRRDAVKFRELCSQWIEFWHIAAPYLMDHPTRPKAKTVGEVLWRVMKARKNLAPMSRMLTSSPHESIESNFESKAVKTMLATYASGSAAPLREGGSAAILGVAMIHIGWGIKRPVGGMQAFADALVGAVRSHGGEARTNAAVEEILVRDGRTTGVRLTNGEVLCAPHVIGSVDPVTLVNKLIDPAHVSDDVRREVDNIRINGWGISTVKVDVALSERPKLLSERADLWGSYMLIADDLAYVDRAQLSALNGVVPIETPMWALMPSAVDRSQVPPGSAGDTMYLFCTAVPHQLADRSPWAEHADIISERSVNTMNQVAPGFADAVIGTWAKTPDVLAEQTHRGSFQTVDLSLGQLGPNRPCPSLSGYKTPIENLWHTGAGAHPMSGVHGWAGRTTAHTVLKQMRKEQRPQRGRSVPPALTNADDPSSTWSRVDGVWPDKRETR